MFCFSAAGIARYVIDNSWNCTCAFELACTPIDSFCNWDYGLLAFTGKATKQL